MHGTNYPKAPLRARSRPLSVRLSRHVVPLAVAMMLLCLLLTVPSTCAAGGPAWPLEGEAPTLLGHGCQYSGKVHRGVDLAAEAGADVFAPCSGRVTFAGSVPATGGGTCTAVSLELEDGRSLTLMPLSDAAVSEATRVEAGQRLGTLAGSGDASAASSHLHVGLKRGDLYLDPMTLLSAPVPAPRADAPATRPVTSALSASAGGSVTQGVAVTAAGAATAMAPGVSLSPGVSLAPAAPVPSPQPTPVTQATPSAPVAPSLSRGVSLASSKTMRVAAAQPSPESVMSSSRSGALAALARLASMAGGLGRLFAVELALVALGVCGAAVRQRSQVAPAADVRPVDQYLAAAADRCYTRRAHFLPRAQPSQSRGRLVQRR